ncbi:YbhB/YbcL family Raf kinase inhibitor-like protein [Leeia oryzae]|uniref:YbhB/YbcL family Raf kinase inhibitor-like protein n=1 Tax=Leeia oryzae TaxID=356662 RepID=UPI00039C2C53
MMKCKVWVAAAVMATAMPLIVLADTFTLSSTDVQDGGVLGQQQFANVFGCSGGNVSPQLSWQHAPADTKSFVLTVYDPDAPTGSGWWHWVVANLPATTNSLPAGAGSDVSRLPASAMPINNDASMPGFLGACPPAGEKHRYVFTVHALKVEKLDLPANATPALVGFMTHMTEIGAASLTAYGSR